MGTPLTDELKAYLVQIGFGSEFVVAMERDCPSLDVLNGFIGFAEKCRAEIGQLNGQLVLTKFQPPPNPSNAGEIERLREEIEENRQQLSELVRLRASNEKFSSQIEERDLSINHLKTKVDALNQEHEDLIFGMEEISSEKLILSEKIDRLNGELEVVRKIASEVMEIRVAHQKTKLHVQKLEDRLRGYEAKISELNSTIVQLKSGTVNMPMCVVNCEQEEDDEEMPQVDTANEEDDEVPNRGEKRRHRRRHRRSRHSAEGKTSQSGRSQSGRRHHREKEKTVEISDRKEGEPDVVNNSPGENQEQNDAESSEQVESAATNSQEIAEPSPPPPQPSDKNQTENLAPVPNRCFWDLIKK